MTCQSGECRSAAPRPADALDAPLQIREGAVFFPNRRPGQQQMGELRRLTHEQFLHDEDSRCEMPPHSSDWGFGLGDIIPDDRQALETLFKGDIHMFGNLHSSARGERTSGDRLVTSAHNRIIEQLIPRRSA